ncbi:MAG: peptidoglycan DD-metalloendopeptidase family protein [Pseudomonadota bacterium]
MNVIRIFLLPFLVIVAVACTRSAPVVTQAFDPNRYIVQTGDTVYSISWRYSQDFRDVIAWNDLTDPYIIHPGQKLIVRKPAGATSVAQSAEIEEPEEETGAQTQPLKKKTISAAQTPTPNNTTSQGTASQATTPQPSANVPKQTPAQKKSNTPENWGWPIRGKLLSKFVNNSLDKQGIDIKGVEGAIVKASRGGEVVYSGGGMIYHGSLIIIKHSETFLSAYAHNSRLLVNEGDAVKSGQAIAHVGTSNAGVAKLHFEIRKNGKPVNPLKYLPSL